MIIALKQLRQSLDISGLSELINEFSSLNKRLLSSQELPNYLRAPISPKMANSPSKLMLAVVNEVGSELDSQIQMIELVGAVILSHIVRILVKLATNNASKLAGDNASTCPLQKELQAES